MSKIVQVKPRYRKRVASTSSFRTLVAISMVGSFAMGAAASVFIDGDNSIAVQVATIGNHINSTGGKFQQPRQVSLADAKPSVAYSRCAGGMRVNCIVDGDTLWSGGVKIRIADIDTPEISEPRCTAEKALGNRATTRLLELVNAGPFQIRAWAGRDEDKYGRKLRVLVRDGRSIGDILVSEGLARSWTGKRQPWCT